MASIQASPEWQFAQVFGEQVEGEKVETADIISVVEFDSTGNYLSTGDRGGRVVLFERVHRDSSGWDETDGPGSATDGRSMFESKRISTEFMYFTEFQSHEPEFDYLKSLDIEEKINKIRWVPSGNDAHFLLSANDKTIKLWKAYEKRFFNVTEFNTLESERMVSRRMTGYPGTDPVKDTTWSCLNVPAVASWAERNGIVGKTFQEQLGMLRMPRLECNETQYAARLRRLYANAHAYHINSISLNSDRETFLSADDLRVNLWNLDISDKSFNILDIKPDNMEELTEVITSAAMHPSHCNIFAYSSSKGVIKLADMRAQALCDKCAKSFEVSVGMNNRTFFSEIIASISDFEFFRDGRYILSRDYMTLKLWDMNMESAPVMTFNVHEQLRNKLCDLYENDRIFDKFGCAVSPDGSKICSGTYSNLIHLFGSDGASDSVIEASRDPLRRRKMIFEGPARPSPTVNINTCPGNGFMDAAETIDFTKKLLHMSWHPKEDIIAVAASNSLYIYSLG